MSDNGKEQDDYGELPVTNPSSEEPAQTVEASPEFIAWLKSLGPDGTDRFVKGSQLMVEMGTLVLDASVAMETGATGELEGFDRRAKVLAARAEVSGFDWLSELMRGSQILIACYLRFARGNHAVTVFRHQRAKQEFQAATTGIRNSLELFDKALQEFPEVPELTEAKASFEQAMYFNRQWQTFIIALEKICDIDELLLQGRVREYLAGVRSLANEMRRLSDSMLAAGSDDPKLLTLSAKMTAMADTIEERADTIEEIEKSRAVYLPPGGDKVFIIHGHAEDKWRELRDLLEDKLGLKGRVIVLKEEASQLKAVISKFEEYAKQCCYGFALVTPDDEVKKDKIKKQATEYRQARPNVIFEIGWFYGRFGPSRLCILKQTGTEIPSDLAGVVTLEFDRDVEEKYIRIKQELETARVLG